MHNDKKVIGREGGQSKPISLYEQGRFPFWDDPHISNSMLKAHLNRKTDRASRKAETIEQTVNWIMGQQHDARKLLDLGCGPGLYAKKCFDAGLAVTGIDLSARSIEYAIGIEDRIDYQVGNYLEIDYVDAFDIITLIYFDFGVLKPDDRRSLLASIKKALRPDGIFVFDILHENSLDGFHEGEEEIDMGNFFTSKPYSLKRESVYYPDSKNTLERYVVQTEDESREYLIWNQLYNKEALTRELESAGFQFDLYNDLTGTAYDGRGKGVGVVAKGV